MIREIRRRLIVDCTFVDEKVTVKALIDPKSYYSSISKALAQKMDLYISREGGSEFPAVQRLGIGATNAGKKVILPSYLRTDTETFVVVDKPEYDLVLGNNWLIWMGKKIDKRDTRY